MNTFMFIFSKEISRNIRFRNNSPIIGTFPRENGKNTEQRENYHINEESKNKSGLLICQVNDSLKRCLKKTCNPHFP